MCGRMLIALLCLHAAPARAGDDVVTASSARALFVARGLSAADAAALERAVAQAVGLELLDDRAVELALEREAAALGPDRETAAATNLRRAREEFIQLRLGAARASFDEALAQLLEDERAPASPAAVAGVYFERALLALASKGRERARRELMVAASIAPGLAPDPDRYGPPALRAWAEARRAVAAAPEVRFVLDWAPADAVVQLDGVPVGREATARGPGPHLLTVSRRGYRARSELITGGKKPVHRDVVLERAEGPLLAQHALLAWRDRTAGSARLEGDGGLWVARSLSITRWVEAAASPDGALELALYDGASGAVLRSVRGAKNAWEPHPWAQVAAALAGRVLSPPPDPSLTVAAPTMVEPGTSIRLEVALTDPAQRVDELFARCGEARATERTRGSARLELILAAPPDEVLVDCVVVARGAGGAELVRAPADGGRSTVRVEAPAAPWYRSWLMWTAIGGAVVGGAALSFALAQPPEQVLVVNGP